MERCNDASGCKACLNREKSVSLSLSFVPCLEAFALPFGIERKNAELTLFPYSEKTIPTYVGIVYPMLHSGASLVASS